MQKTTSGNGIFSTSMALVGTVIGAGFASGQEIMQFFCDFGIQGVDGVLISALGFFLCAMLVMVLAQKLRTDHYLVLLNGFGVRWLNPVIDSILFGCSLGTQIVMVAGGGVLLETQLGIPSLLGSALLLLLNGAASWNGSNGIMKGFSISVPILLIGSVCVAAYAIINPPIMQHVATTRLPNPMVGNWLTAALLFVFHNMLSAIGILAPLAHQAKRKRSLLCASFLAAVCLGILGLTLVLCILKNYPMIQDAPMPMQALASALSPGIGLLYTLLMLCAIFSTTIGLTLGMGTRLSNTSWFLPAWHKQYIVIMSLLCLIMSRIGFVSLMSKLYPSFGYISILAFVCMLINIIKTKE